jgi:hypothetical protein
MKCKILYHRHIASIFRFSTVCYSDSHYCTIPDSARVAEPLWYERLSTAWLYSMVGFDTISCHTLVTIHSSWATKLFEWPWSMQLWGRQFVYTP